MTALSMDPGAVGEVAGHLRSLAGRATTGGSVSGGSTFGEVAAAIRAVDGALEQAAAELDQLGGALEATAQGARGADRWGGGAPVAR